MNSVVLSGRLIKDLELKFTQGGQPIASGVIAVDRKFKKNGEKVADFFNISLFGKIAELTCQYCGKKGDMLNVRGNLQTSTYNKRDGSKGYTVSVYCEEVDFLTASSRQREDVAPTPIATPPQQQPQPQNEFTVTEVEDDFDPFDLSHYEKQATDDNKDLTDFLKQLASEGK